MKKKQSSHFISTILLSILIGGTISFSGCGNTSIFQGLSGGGGSVGGTTGAQQALDNGNYSEAISKANEVINSNIPSADKQQALIVKGEAIMGQSNVTAATIIASFEATSTSANQNIFSILPAGIDLQTATAAAEALNDAYDISQEGSQSLSVPKTRILTTTTSNGFTKDQYLARLLANGIVVNKMVSYVWTITDTGIEVNPPYDLMDTLAYLFPSSTRSAMYYTNVVNSTKNFCGLSQDKIDIITKIVDCMTNINSIYEATHVGGTPYTYAHGTINSSSSTTNIKAAIDYNVVNAR